jgi:peptidyl-prolyl cis-trans isomerase D
MATLERIRNKAGLLIAIIGVAMLAFILGDFLNSGGSMFSGNRNEIAKINGISVSIDEYQDMINNLEENYKRNARTNTIDAITRDRLSDQAWEYLVQEKVMEKQYEELGIDVTGEELFDMINGREPHPTIRRVFVDENGIFNKSIVLPQLKYLLESDDPQALAQWKPIEDQIFHERKAEKYSVLVQKGIYSTHLDAEMNLKNNSKTFNLTYVMKRFNEVPDSLISISNKDIQKYYSENKDSYKQEETRDIEYVVFDVEASEADKRNTLAEITEIKAEFAEIEEVEQYVNLNSDPEFRFDRTNYKKEDLDEEISNALWDAPEGTVYGPYLENEVYKIAKIASDNFLPDSVRARHILLAPQTQQEVPAYQAKADSLLDLLKNKNANFVQLAVQNSDDQVSLAENADLGWFKTIQWGAQFEDSCFYGETGDIKLVISQFGFHIVEILDQSAKEKKVQVGIIARAISPSDETRDMYYQKAGKFAAANRNVEQFKAAAKEQGLVPRFAPGLGEMDKFIAGLESPRPVIKWAYKEAEVGDVSSVFELGEKYVVAALVKASEEGYAKLDDKRNEIEIAVRKQKKAEYISNEFANVLSTVSDIDAFSDAVGISVKAAPQLNFGGRFIPGAGAEPAVIAAASVLSENQVSKPITGESGVFVVSINNVVQNSIDQAAIAQEKVNLNNSQISRFYQNQGPIVALKNSADIDDNRAVFY